MEISRRKFLAAVGSLVAAVSLPIKAATEIEETLSARADLMLKEEVVSSPSKAREFIPGSGFALIIGGQSLDKSSIKQWNYSEDRREILEHRWGECAVKSFGGPSRKILQVDISKGERIDPAVGKEVLFQSCPDRSGYSIVFKGIIVAQSFSVWGGVHEYSFEAEGTEDSFVCGKN